MNLSVSSHRKPEAVVPHAMSHDSVLYFCDCDLE
jgi:hypothetical protein